MIQDQQIYNDALTNLNNRRHLNHFLEERLSKASPERPVTVYMIDINGFKSINDRFGHVEATTPYVSLPMFSVMSVVVIMLLSLAMVGMNSAWFLILLVSKLKRWSRL